MTDNRLLARLLLFQHWNLAPCSKIPSVVKAMIMSDVFTH